MAAVPASCKVLFLSLDKADSAWTAVQRVLCEDGLSIVECGCLAMPGNPPSVWEFVCWDTGTSC